MKKSTIITIVIFIVIIAGIIWFGRGSSNAPATAGQEGNQSASTTQTAPVSVTETTKVSSKTSQFENAELGFSVNYPTAWETLNTDNGVSFIMPIDQTQVSTVNKVQVDITATSMKCAFPPVTTIKDRGTLSVAGSKLNMISMSNSVQGRNYFNRMYSLQKDSICYIFAFSSVTLSPESKKLTGSNKTQAENNNKAIIATADTAFTDMVKTFQFVTGPAGQDEAKVAPAKK